MRQKISFVQTMVVDCLSCHKTELEAQFAYDRNPDAYAIMCAKAIDRCYWMVMNREQMSAYGSKWAFIRGIMEE